MRERLPFSHGKLQNSRDIFQYEITMIVRQGLWEESGLYLEKQQRRAADLGLIDICVLSVDFRNPPGELQFCQNQSRLLERHTEFF